MKKLTGKLILPVLLGLLLGLATFALAAQEHGDGVKAGVAASGEMVAAAAQHEAVAAAGEHEGAGAHEAHGEGHSSVTPAKLKDLFWLTVNFLFLVAILVKYLAKPISAGLAGRQNQVAEELRLLEEKRDDAERKYKEFAAKLSGMEEEMDTIVQKAIAQAENEKKRILDEAEKAAKDIKRQAEAAVQAELVDAKRRLRNEAAEQAAAMAEELIVKNLTAEDQVAITEQFLERVGAVQ